MKDNACHIPGSTRSRRTPLSRSFPYFLPSLLSPVRPKNPYKTRTKSDHFRICEFFNHSASTTYNFNALKCTDFRISLNLNRNLRGRIAPEGFGDCRLPGTALSHFSRTCLRTCVFAALRLCVNSIVATDFTILYKTGQNGTISDLFRKRPRCTNDLRRYRSRSSHFGFWNFSGPWSLGFGVPHWCPFVKFVSPNQN